MSLFRAITRKISTENVREFLKMSDNGFDGVLKKVKIITCGEGNCLAELKLDKEHVNTMDALHGGLSATLVVTISSCALLSHEKALMMPNVSVDLHISYIKGATIGDEIVIDAKTEKAGKSIAYLKCEIRNKATGDILAKGSHTKCIIHPKE